MLYVPLKPIILFGCWSLGLLNRCHDLGLKRLLFKLEKVLTLYLNSRQISRMSWRLEMLHKVRNLDSWLMISQIRTKNIVASKARTEAFISTVSQGVQPALQQSASPLYGTPSRGTPSPGADLLSLNLPGEHQLLVRIIKA